MRTRVVEPEILDQLDPEDPEAIRNRKEIDGINRWMGNYKWILKAFRMVVRENESVIEIGAGGDRLAGRILDSGSETTITGYRCVDVIPAPKDLDPRVDWVQSDVTQFDGSQNASVLISNFSFINSRMRRSWIWASGCCRSWIPLSLMSLFGVVSISFCPTSRSLFSAMEGLLEPMAE
jgi:hypothetical protein